MDSLRGVSGGRKQLWLRQNHELVVQYHDAFGREATLERFVMEPGTLDKLLATRPDKRLKQTESDKINFRVAHLVERVNMAEAEVRSLKRDYGKFTEVVADTISRQFLEPLLRHTIQMPDSLVLQPRDNPLKLDVGDNERK